MAEPRPRLMLGFALTVSLLGLVSLRQLRPTGILETFGLAALAHLACIFTAWLLAVLGWGRSLMRIVLGDEGAAFGRAAWITVAAALGSLFAAQWHLAVVSLPSSARYVFGSFFIVVGGALNVITRAKPRVRPRLSRAEWLLGAFLALYVSVRFVQVTRLARHGDPLYYHLVAPVLWCRQHGLQFDNARPLDYVASLWEGLYVFPAQWFLRSGDVGLPQVQIFAQWIHLTLGWALCGALSYALLRSLRLPRVPAMLGSFAALTTRSLWWTGGLAKNDCGAASWALAGLLVLFAAPRPTARRYFAAAILLGAAFMAKYTAAFAIVPLLLLFLFRAGPRRLGLLLPLGTALVLGGVLGGIPIIIRNTANVGMPLFPFGARATKSQLLSETTLDYIGGLSPSGIAPGWKWRLQRLGELSQEGTLAPACALAPVLIWFVASRRWKRVRLDGRWSTFAMGAIASLALFLLIARAGTDFRLLGPGLLLLSVVGTITTFLLLRLLRRSRSFSPLPAAFFTFAALAATSRFAPEAILDRIHDLPLQRGLAAHTAGDAKMWAATLPRSRIITTGDNEIYYLLEHDVLVATDDPAEDRRWRQAMLAHLPPEVLLHEWHRLGFVYLLDTAFPGEPAPLREYLWPAIERHPEWIAFRGREAVVLSLQGAE